MSNDFDYLKTDAELLGRNVALLLNKIVTLKPNSVQAHAAPPE